MTQKPTDTPIIYVPVGRAITANPGDQLMIVMGTCVGVYTGTDAVVPPSAKPAQPVATKRTYSKRNPNGMGPKDRSQYAALALGQRGDPPAGSYTPMVNALREYLPRMAASSPAPRHTILTAMLNGKVDVGNKEWKFREGLNYLIGTGEVEASGKSQTRSYKWVRSIQEAA